MWTAGPIELQSERLHLRQWRDDDVAHFAAMNADPCVMEHFPTLQSHETSAAAVTRWSARIAERGWGLWALELRRTGEFIGFETLGLDEIVSFTAVGNRHSRAVMERLGMTEDTQTFENPNVPVGSPVREHCLYRLKRSAWLAMAPAAVKTSADASCRR